MRLSQRKTTPPDPEADMKISCTGCRLRAGERVLKWMVDVNAEMGG